MDGRLIREAFGLGLQCEVGRLRLFQASLCPAAKSVELGYPPHSHRPVFPGQYG